jgi:hypothetical protein
VTKLLLSIHVLAAIIAIGPVAVAASMFPAATRHALADPDDPRGVAVLRNLHRICRVYAVLGVLVPVFGLATASALDVLGDAWLIASMILTAVATAVLAFLVLPGQAAALTDLTRPQSAGSAPAPDGATTPGTGPTRSDSATTPGTRRTTPDITTAGIRPTTPEGAAVLARAAVRRLGMVTGVFNLLWAVVVVLMIVRPGSTTGA